MTGRRLRSEIRERMWFLMGLRWLPGAMFMLAYYNRKIPIVGLPGCVMYAKRTVLDLVLPRIMADESL